MTTFKQAIREAVKAKDAVRAGRLCDVLRYKYHADYGDTLEFFQRCCPELTPDQFEALMYEADLHDLHKG